MSDVSFGIDTFGDVTAGPDGPVEHGCSPADGGRVAAQGAMETVFAPETLARVYGMDVYGWMRGLLGQWSGA